MAVWTGSGWMDQNINTVKLSLKENQFRLEEKCFQTRGENLIRLITLALESLMSEEGYKNVRVKNFDLYFYTGDVCAQYVNGWGELPYYSMSGENNTDRLCPDFNFSGWPEVGIYDYDTTCKEIVKASATKPECDKMFWAGNINTHANRKKFFKMVQGDERIICHDVMGWAHVQGAKRLKTISGQYTTLPQHCKYKYLIDIEGEGYSGRVKHLLFTGRPLFYPERRFKEYWSFNLKPYVHYIPVKNDLSDFFEKLDWAINNEDKCNRIARQAQEFAIKNLRMKNAVDKFKEIIVKELVTHDAV